MAKLFDGTAPYEMVLLVVILGMAMLRPRFAGPALDGIEAWLRRVTPARAIVITMALAVMGRAVFLPVLGLPQAHGGDQASLLLQAETFLAGRLANPLHPWHAFFESVYVNQGPAYGSMYFPGRSLALAAGLALFDSPGAGVWLSMVILSGVLVWMLQGYVGAGASLVGGLIFVFKFALFSFWINSLFAVEVPAIGGALVVGAWVRLGRQQRWRDAVLLGTGLLLLLLARPFEGFLFCLPIAVMLGWRALGLVRRRDWAPLTALLLPPALLVGLGVGIVLAHDVANTGNALVTPYALNRTAYAATPVFLFETAVPPQRAVAEPVAGFYRLEGLGFERYRSGSGIATSSFAKLRNFAGFYLGPLLVLPFVAGLPWLWRRQRVLAASFATMVGGIMLLQFSWSHYFAPALGLVLLVVVAGLRRLHGWRAAKGGAGRFIARALPLAVVGMAVVPASALVTGRPAFHNSVYAACCFLGQGGDDRDEIERLLAGLPGDDLVFVRYRPADSRWKQWVYNGADIDAQRIIWAHDLGDAADRRLMAHYPGRRAWRVDGLTPWRLRALDGDGAAYDKPGSSRPD